MGLKNGALTVLTFQITLFQTKGYGYMYALWLLLVSELLGQIEDFRKKSGRFAT